VATARMVTARVSCVCVATARMVTARVSCVCVVTARMVSARKLYACVATARRYVWLVTAMSCFVYLCGWSPCGLPHHCGQPRNSLK